MNESNMTYLGWKANLRHAKHIPLHGATHFQAVPENPRSGYVFTILPIRDLNKFQWFDGQVAIARVKYYQEKARD